MSQVEYDLRRETDAARDLLTALRASGDADDAELVADTIEGETDLTEAIGKALEEIDECDVIEAGAKAKAAEYSARADTFARRRDRIRAAIEQAMVAVDQTALRLPAATLSITRRPRQVVVDNEAEIPAQFFRQPDPPAPKLDKKALAEALAAGDVPGARLDNGSISLTIRRK